MKIEAVLFDLDGTLLPMDQEQFMRAYFDGLADFLAPYGYDRKRLISSIWQGSEAMIKNDGKRTNEAVFWDKFQECYGKDVRCDEPYFEAYYKKDFDKVSGVCGYNPHAKRAVADIRAMGLRVALATNPLFPSIATEKRVGWTGLSVSDFELYTTYENSRFCKPNPFYYQEILCKMNLKPEHTLMVGNDAFEDMVASELGMSVFLLTDCLINRGNKDISIYPGGGFEELVDYVKSLSC